MRQILRNVMVLVTFMASTAMAQQARISVGGGLMLPSGDWDYPGVNGAGWQLMGAVEVTIPRSRFGLRVDGMYGEIGYDDPFIVDPTKLNGLTANVTYYLGAPIAPLRLYLLTGAGYCVFNGESNAAFAGGAGLTFGPRSLKAFVEGRFVTVRASGGALNFIPVTAGLSFGL